MSIPGRVEAASLLLALDPPAWFLRHVAGVAEVAGYLARRAAARGVALDPRLVEAAGLLHDVDKLLPRSDPARRLLHGVGSAVWLGRRGHGELAEAVVAHPVGRLADGPLVGSPEARLVAYADKRVGQRLEPMAARFGAWDRRYPGASDGPDAWDAAQVARARERAAELEREVCALAGVAPADVRRLRWVSRALASARPRRARGAA